MYQPLSIVLGADFPIPMPVLILALVVAILLIIGAIYLILSLRNKKTTTTNTESSSGWQPTNSPNTAGVGSGTNVGWNSQAGQTSNWNQQNQQNPWNAQASSVSQPGSNPSWGTPVAQQQQQQVSNPWGASSPNQGAANPWGSSSPNQGVANPWGASSPNQGAANPWGAPAAQQQQQVQPANANPWGAQTPQPGGNWDATVNAQAPNQQQAWGTPQAQVQAQPSLSGNTPAQPSWNMASPQTGEPSWNNNPQASNPGMWQQQAQGGFAGIGGNDADKTVLRPNNQLASQAGLTGYVRVEEGKEPGRIYEARKESLSIGRSRDSDIFLEDLAVSRLHASIVNMGNGNYALKDEGSANGTKVNGQLVNKFQTYPLQEGDRVQLGQTVLVFGRK